MEKKNIVLLGLDGEQRKKLLDLFCQKDKDFIKNKDFIRTIGIDFVLKNVENRQILVWDTLFFSGRKCPSVQKDQLKTKDAAMVLYDVNNKVTFEEIDKYFFHLRNEKPDIKIVIVGVNFEEDLNANCVKTEDGQIKAILLASDFYEIQKTTKESVDEAFKILIDKIL